MKRFFRTTIFLALTAAVFTTGVFIIRAVNNRGNAPVAYWKFDEGYGTTAYDAAGANDGTITNAVWKNEPECKSGKCLYFDGDGDYVSVADSASLNITGDVMTIAAWIKSPLGWSGTSWRTIVGKGTTSGYQLYLDSTGLLRFETESSGERGIQTTDSITANQWSFVVARYDGSTMKIFMDGIEKATGDYSGNIDTSSGIALTIGVDVAAGTRDFHGFIDSPKIYDYARTAAQIKADYLGGASRGSSVIQNSKFKIQNSSEGLVGHWKMDESSWTVDCSTDTVMDSSGAGNNGDACPNLGGLAPAAGKYGNAGLFDGTEDYVKIPDIDF